MKANSSNSNSHKHPAARLGWRSVFYLAQAPSGVWFRFQAPGLSPVGHTSEGSSEPLRPGYVFACPSAEALWTTPDFYPGDDDAQEVVAFYGDDSYDPGDLDGYAVRATGVAARFPWWTAAAWCWRLHRDENALDWIVTGRGRGGCPLSAAEKAAVCRILDTK